MEQVIAWIALALFNALYNGLVHKEPTLNSPPAIERAAEPSLFFELTGRDVGEYGAAQQ